MTRFWIVVLSCLTPGAFAAFDHSQAAWNSILRAHVTTKGPVSTVAYAALKKNPAALDAYLRSVSDVKAAELEAFAPKEKLAFLINAYNAFTVKLIVDSYPLKSIKDLGGLFASPWKKKFFSLGGAEENLDGIEHDRIRKKFDEPRIHFVLVCASKGCPALKDEAFVAARLDDQMEAATKVFLADSSRNRYDPKKNRLSLSKIFDWYSLDFEKKAGSVSAFVAPYFGSNAAEIEKVKTASVTHLDYDWKLNETR